MSKKIILTDCDGVLLNWEYAFGVWMERKGYELVEGHQFIYNVHEKYGLDSKHGHQLCRDFNESAAVGFIPALRDAVQYVRILNEDFDINFHVITSLSEIPEAQTLRIQNLTKLFGHMAFERFIILDTGEDKDNALDEYRDTGYHWIEDKPDNALLGLNYGLKPILMEHGHNMHMRDVVTGAVPIVTNWQEVLEIVV